ncbi:hypothetical protein LCI18_013977 [Fusarium solani-melongenae]|uniref:Uncharacterized protein n=1 Tax=Fusarium solani subsp. cucurbitae TaxID=2747967 RepID=A0ACD3ZPJ2_FUSSC|nr:hypothetical protein LCI18_013977 [Fusarium solani-melongenae]
MSDAQGTPDETPPGGLSRLPSRTQKGIDGIQKLMGKTPMELIPECPHTRWSTNLVEEFRSLVNTVKKQRNPKPYSFEEIKSFLLEKAQEHDVKRRTSLEASDVRAAKYHFFGSGQGAGEDNDDRDNAVPGLRNKRPTRDPSAETIPQPTYKRVKTHNQDRETPHTTPTTPSNEGGFITDLNNIIRRCENSIGLLIAKASREQVLRVEQRQRDLNHARDIHQRKEVVTKLDKTSSEAKNNLIQATKRLGTAEALFAALENAVGTLDAPPEMYLAQVRQSRDKAITNHDFASQKDGIEVKKVEEAKRKRDETAKQVVDLQTEFETQENRQAMDAKALVGAETLRKLLDTYVTDLKPLTDAFPGFMGAVDRLAERNEGRGLTKGETSYWNDV